MKYKVLVILLSVSIIMTIGCVPSRKYNDLLENKAKLEKKYNENQDNYSSSLREVKQLRMKVDEYVTVLNKQKEDSSAQQLMLANLQSEYDNLNSRYLATLEQSELQLSSSSTELSTLNTKLATKQKELDDKENQLRITAQKLDKSRDEIQKAQTQLSDAQAKFEEAKTTLAEKEKSVNTLQKELAEREKRVQELEAIIKKQEEQSNTLRNKINSALLGFNGDDLTVEQRDGKVYVSLSQNLLFSSGSTSIDSKGKEALSKLASVLKKDSDFDILIEGHTDNVPLRGSGQIKDNWDLSVMRSTSIVKELVKSGVLPERIIAAGRGEHIPKSDNSTKDGRAQNRRSEIILSPKLDELYKVINN